MNTVEKKIQDKNFIFEKPWFHRNKLALRCSLFDNNFTKKQIVERGFEIFNIIFDETKVDCLFTHEYQYKVYRINYSLYSKENEFELEINNLLVEKEYEDLISIKRNIVYNLRNFDFKEIIASQIINIHNSRIHFVSFENQLIFTIDENYTCDIVFFNEKKFIEFYRKLEKYLLDRDYSYMKENYDKLIQRKN